MWGCLADWTRFRPWLYQGMALLLCFSLPQPLDAARLILASIYLWAGVLKINRTWTVTVYPWITEPLRRRLPQPLAQATLRLAPVAPWLEALGGLGLLFPTTRGAACLGLIAMHVFILACFHRRHDSHYPTIWPWNVSMALCSWIVFWGSAASPLSILLTPPLLLFTLLPAWGLTNRLDPVFSHGHMTGRHVVGVLSLSRRLVSRLPPELQAHCKRGGYFLTLDIGAWFLAELHVPPPQQERLLRLVALSFERYGPGEHDLTLTVAGMPGFRCHQPPVTTWSWSELVASAKPDPG